QFTGGGVVHGPVPRDYSQRVNKKMKAAALRGALSDRARAGAVYVIENFVTGETPRTKDALAALNELNWVSLRNLAHVHLLDAGQVNTYDVLNSDAVIFTAAALDEFLGVPAERTEVEIKVVSTKKKSAKDDDETEDEPKSKSKRAKAKSKTKADDDEAEVDEIDDEIDDVADD